MQNEGGKETHPSMEENLCPLKEEYVEWVGHDNGTMFGKYNPSLRVGELDRLFLPTAHIVWGVCVCAVFPLTSYPRLPAVWNLTLEKAPYLSIFWAMGQLGRECQALFSTF